MALFRRQRTSARRLLTIVVHQHSVSFCIAEIAVHAAEPSSLVINDQVAARTGAWVETIEKLLQQYKRFLQPDMPVQLVLGLSLYQSVLIDRPQLPPEELASGLKFALRELVSLSPSQIIADYYELPAQPAGSDKINVVVADKKQLEPMLASLRDAKLALQGISVVELANARLVTDTIDPVMFLLQRAGEPIVVQIVSEEKLFLSRQVRGFEKLAEYSTDELKMGALDPLSVEMQRSLDYFDSQLRQRPVAAIKCALPFNPASAVHEALQQQLGLTVSGLTYPHWAQELASGDFSDLAALGGTLLLIDALTQGAE